MAACGVFHTLTVDDEDNLWSFGANEYFQCGIQGDSKIKFPTVVSDVKGVCFVAAGEYHSAIVDNNGDLWTFGKNNYGQLGYREKQSNKNLPKKVDALENVIQIACGEFHTICIDRNNVVYGFGSNENGQLGIGNNECKEKLIFYPIPIQSLNNICIMAVACGEFHSIFLSDQGNVYSSGDNDSSQLGLGDSEITASHTPILNPFLSDIEKISCGDKYTMVLSINNKVYSFGSNSYLQLGYKTSNITQPIPRVVDQVPSTTILSVTCGGAHSLLLDSEGYIWACGWNGYGQLALDVATDTSIFTKVEIPNVESVFAGYSHTIIKTTSNIHGFGTNFDGRAGGGALTDDISSVKLRSSSIFKEEFFSIIRTTRRYSRVKSARK